MERWIKINSKLGVPCTHDHSCSKPASYVEIEEQDGHVIGVVGAACDKHREERP